jgi:ABC-type phosphate/phosphonate transport system substrate-binding protein
MSAFVAALPMYDWPELHAETDAEWARLCELLRAADIEAPAALARRNADLPPVPGGIRSASGVLVAPDPSTLPPDALDLAVLWGHPRLLLAQTCWGPMELGLAPLVKVVGQPDYSAFEGGEGPFYSSVVLMRRAAAGGRETGPPRSGALLPVDRLRGRRFAFNSRDSMSGYISLERDLKAAGETMGIFSAVIETDGHRASVVAVAEGRADACAIDCRSWALARRLEPCAEGLAAAGWTARRLGLPYIASMHLPAETAVRMRAILRHAGAVC